jgi:pyruvate ferredoxin oxidoreductase alpha subunit
VMVMQDGFITSHGVERVEVYDDDKVRKFLGKYIPSYPLLDIDNPVTYGPLDFYDYYYEHKRQQVEAMRNAFAVIEEIGKEFGREFGRTYGFLETYQMDDADVALVVLSSTAGTARSAIDALRAKGHKVGLVKPRVFRPFPIDHLLGALEGVSAVGVMDRAISFGSLSNGGPLWIELCAAAYQRGFNVPIADYVFGLGGRNISPKEVEEICRHVLLVAERGAVDQMVHYVGVRGEEPLLAHETA